MEKLSKLVKVVRPCHVNIRVDLHLSAFWDRRNTKNHDRNVLAEPSLSAYSMGGCKQSFGSEELVQEQELGGGEHAAGGDPEVASEGFCNG